MPIQPAIPLTWVDTVLGSTLPFSTSFFSVLHSVSPTYAIGLDSGAVDGVVELLVDPVTKQWAQFNKVPVWPEFQPEEFLQTTEHFLFVEDNTIVFLGVSGVGGDFTPHVYSRAVTFGSTFGQVSLGPLGSDTGPNAPVITGGHSFDSSISVEAIATSSSTYIWTRNYSTNLGGVFSSFNRWIAGVGGGAVGADYSAANDYGPNDLGLGAYDEQGGGFRGIHPLWGGVDGEAVIAGVAATSDGTPTTIDGVCQGTPSGLSNFTESAGPYGDGGWPLARSSMWGNGRHGHFEPGTVNHPVVEDLTPFVVNGMGWDPLPMFETAVGVSFYFPVTMEPLGVGSISGRDSPGNILRYYDYWSTGLNLAAYSYFGLSRVEPLIVDPSAGVLFWCRPVTATDPVQIQLLALDVAVPGGDGYKQWTVGAVTWCDRTAIGEG